ncbi:MAG: trigger factor [Ruminococcaceae bacterium]|nr:trigger factor [Oscillospiraceae bacterium]
MSLIKTENLEKSRASIEFSIEKAALEAEIVKVYKQQIGKMNIPGFRKGKAPLAMVRKLYGQGVFTDEALNNLLPDAYEEAIKESGLAVISRPEFDIVSMDEGDVVVLKAVFDVKPEAVVKEYKGLKAEKEVTEVTDEMVENDIKAAQKRAAREIEVTDRAAEMDDTADIDFEGFVDGVAFEGGKGEHHKLKLGSGQFIPGFEEQIVGKNIGEEFDVNVTFPEEYGAKELAGKPAVFKCKLHALTKEELPELDDEFAKDQSFDNMEAYRADVRAKLVERYEKAADQVVENRILDALVANMEVEIPESMFVNEVENELREYDMQLRSNGLDLNTYFKYTGQNLDQLRENFRPRAERSVKVRLALEAVVKAEGIAATEEEIEAEYKRMAEMYSMEIDKVKAAIASEDLAADLNVQAALKLVKENAEITVKKAEDAE